MDSRQQRVSSALLPTAWPGQFVFNITIWTLAEMSSLSALQLAGFLSPLVAWGCSVEWCSFLLPLCFCPSRWPCLPSACPMGFASLENTNTTSINDKANHLELLGFRFVLNVTMVTKQRFSTLTPWEWCDFPPSLYHLTNLFPSESPHPNLVQITGSFAKQACLPVLSAASFAWKPWREVAFLLTYWIGLRETVLLSLNHLVCSPKCR